MNYKESVDFLYSQLPAYHRIGKAAYKNDLHNTIALDDYLGHPHKKYKTIHIAGTNGKGSVSHLIASVLMEAGYKTGLYTSPHLKDFRERIRVNGKPIEKKKVTQFVKEHSEIINSLKPSFFEITVALAFDHFARSHVDIAVIEVGLGGRLDSTNIITPVLSVITNIGHDHMDLLGNTLELVAAEKAGIIKKSIPVVVSETQDEIKGIFIGRADETGSEISFADQNFVCTLDDFNAETGERRFKITEKKSDNSYTGNIPTSGDYQSKNLQALFQVFKILKDDLRITDSDIINGVRHVVRKTGLLGRWQVLSHKPLIICDTGHNKEGLTYVMNQIERIPRTKLLFVLGFVNDKDLSLVLPLFPSDADYYFTKASVPRALDEKILMSVASKYNLQGRSFPNVKAALEAAKDAAFETDVIFIGGSTFIVAEVV
ncbi:MAG TPA: folylpolyglutamate synthase/dihydrofolate synthase family protein [Bacteroidales bacterium]|nr:folylpolyglutamate synthase/dihydrofolate synthase family protein [Bacteroidales bacterium]